MNEVPIVLEDADNSGVTIKVGGKVIYIPIDKTGKSERDIAIEIAEAINKEVGNLVKATVLGKKPVKKINFKIVNNINK